MSRWELFLLINPSKQPLFDGPRSANSECVHVTASGWAVASECVTLPLFWSCANAITVHFKVISWPTDFGFRGFVLWESSLTHKWQRCNYGFVLWQSFNWSHSRWKVKMRVVAFVEANLVLTFIVLSFLSLLFCFLVLGCKSVFEKKSKEKCRRNMGVILHLRLCCLVENTSIFHVEHRARGDNEVIQTETQTAVKHQTLSQCGQSAGAAV